MQIASRVDFVSLDGAVVGVDAGEGDLGAEVVAALRAEEAGSAGDAGLDSDAVAWDSSLHQYMLMLVDNHERSSGR